MSQFIYVQMLNYKFHIFIFLTFSVSLSFAYFSESAANYSLTFLNKAVASSECSDYKTYKYRLDANKYIEWIPDSQNPQNIRGYRIWLKDIVENIDENIDENIEENIDENIEELENSSYTLLEQTYVRSNIPISYLKDQCHNQLIHHIGPLMLFIEIKQTLDFEYYEHTQVSYFDIIANELLPDFLFEELVEARDADFNIKEPVALPWLTDSNTYIIQTDNYFAHFLVDYVCFEHCGQDTSYAYQTLKLMDPIKPEQYSLVFVP